MHGGPGTRSRNPREARRRDDAHRHHAYMLMAQPACTFQERSSIDGVVWSGLLTRQCSRCGVDGLVGSPTAICADYNVYVIV